MPAPNTIELFLRGLLSIFIDKDKSRCKVGILKDPPPHHQLTINYRTSLAGGALQPPEGITVPFNNELSIEVQGTSQPNIVLNDPVPNLNRMDRTQHPDSASWFVDLENPAELYKNPIGASAAGFKSFLTFNGGTLFTDEISRNVLFVQRGMFADYERFGFVAVRIRVLITLDQPTSTAVFKSGGVPVFTTAPNTDYRIEITHDAEGHPGIVTDANYYYKAVGLGLSEAERIRFLSVDPSRLISTEDKTHLLSALGKLLGDELTKASPEADDGVGPPAGPEAACFSGYHSQTDPP